MAVDQCLPCQEPVTLLHSSDFQHCGLSCTFRCGGMCHRLLKVQFNVLVVCFLTTASRPESPFRDLLDQPHASDRHSPAMQRPRLRTLRVACCPTNTSGRGALRPAFEVDFLPRRFVYCSYSQWRWSDSVMTRSLVRLAEESPSFCCH